MRVARGGGGGRGPASSNWNATSDKNITEKTIVCAVFLASSRTTVINNNIDPGSPGPLV